MKKILITASVVIIFVVVCAYIFIPIVVLNMITTYEPYTFETVLGNTEMRADFAIPLQNKPEDYGFKSEEIDFKSLDDTQLNGWYIPAKKPTNHSLVLIHGRTSNRLKTMKYLALIDSLELDTCYNVFIPDLRNSGKSEPSKTYMGYKFGEDVTASLLMLHHKYQQDTFFLYGFSMGAMAVANAVGRAELAKQEQAANIVIEKIILDSPLANVKKTLQKQSEEVAIAKPFFKDIFSKYSDEIHGFGEHMRLSELLDANIPTLILQSEDDKTTLAKILKEEVLEMPQFNKLKVVYFHGPEHVRIFQDSTLKVDYINAVGNFVRSN
jgi:hypothetical protein